MNVPSPFTKWCPAFGAWIHGRSKKNLKKKRGLLDPQNGSQVQLLGSHILFFPDRLSLLAASRGVTPLRGGVLVHTGDMNGPGSFWGSRYGALKWGL